MSLDGIRSIRLLAGVQETGAVRRKGSSSAGAADAVDDTSDADTVGSAKMKGYLSAVRSASGDRAERVAALRTAIANGTYDIPMDRLVQGLVGGSS